VLEQIDQDLTNIWMQDFGADQSTVQPVNSKIPHGPLNFIAHTSNTGTGPCKQAALKLAETMTTCWPSYAPNWA